MPVELRNKRTYTAEVIQDYVAPDSTKHQVIRENIYASPEAAFAVDTGYVDSIAMALNIANSQITSLLRANANLEGKLQASAVTMDSLNKRVYTFNGDFLKAVLTERDSMLNYKYNAELNIVNYWKRKWVLGQKEYFIDLSARDPNMRINGLSQFTVRQAIPDNNFGIGIQAGYYFDPETGTFRPAIGAGISYNIVRF